MKIAEAVAIAFYATLLADPATIVDRRPEDSMIKRLKFVSIPNRDQERALAFWTEKMGFKVSTDQPMGEGKRWIELSIPGAETGIVLFTPEGQEDRIGSFFNGSFAC